MNNPQNILTRIAELTTKIETEYPELYHFLDENPVTLPSEIHPEVHMKELQDYLDSLQQLLDKHMKTHTKTNLIT
ncbi:hypothetical protein [Maribacter luteus]|uniref:Uncharacterized protein n=1 Tax=Maribacter luteus TaxID=2594478 RepID=A0A6I2MM05_9FLAO|nr:hypothetical protein [Maribacter luteus]MRX63530.1 hypothetical protein [Maribacter luteus]|tara:strand:+ start:1163 stop:1387 length:225 start_codon:yes stop_codon:yes gene_type:complete